MRLTNFLSNYFKLFELNPTYYNHRVTRLHKLNLTSNALGKNVNYPGIRYIYTPASLGINDFIHRREKWQNKFMMTKETFINKMSEMCRNEEGMYNVYSEDLRNMLYLCERNKQNLELLLQMAKTYYAREKTSSSIDSSYAVEYMRLCFYFELPNEARKVLNEEKLSGFFNHIFTYNVAMSLFYNSGHYEEVIKITHKLVDEKIFMRILPRSIFLLTMAACYKLNSPGSLDEALHFVKTTEMVNARLEPKGLSFASALALKQKNPLVALELSSKTPWNFYLLKNIKAEALAMIGRPEEALPILRGYSGGYECISLHQEKDLLVFLTTLNNIEKALIKQNEAENLSEFYMIKERLQEQHRIVNKSLDEALSEAATLEEIEERKARNSLTDERKKKRQMFAASFERGRIKEKMEKSFERTGFTRVK